jgi:hypothetical protein
MNRRMTAPPVDGLSPPRRRRGLPLYQRAPSSRLWTAQGALAANLVSFPDSPRRLDALRVRNAPANVFFHPPLHVPHTIPRPLPHYPSTLSGIPVNRTLMRLTGIPLQEWRPLKSSARAVCFPCGPASFWSALALPEPARLYSPRRTGVLIVEKVRVWWSYRRRALLHPPPSSPSRPAVAPPCIPGPRP